jgi:hypothetical protein
VRLGRLGSHRDIQGDWGVIVRLGRLGSHRDIQGDWGVIVRHMETEES